MGLTGLTPLTDRIAVRPCDSGTDIYVRSDVHGLKWEFSTHLDTVDLAAMVDAFKDNSALLAEAP